LIIFLFLAFLFDLPEANAASLYFSSSSNSYTVGDIFTVNVLVDTEGQAINAAESTINFPIDFLEVISTNKSGAIFSLWVEEPTFSNSAGTISFVGGLPNPGFNGTAGKIISVVFRVKKAGSATVIFASGVVRANDGFGTDILKTRSQLQFTLVSAEALPPTTPAVAVTPEAPKVFSLTHPNSDKWYPNNSPEFAWQLPSDINGVSLIINKSAVSDPGSSSDGLMQTKKYENIEDGTWYLHIKFRNEHGWGKITHRRVLIDTTPPSPFTIEIQKESPTDPTPVLIFETVDQTSGIEYYEIRVGDYDADKVLVEDFTDGVYKLPVLLPGEYTIVITAVDRAGNLVSATTSVTIESIKAPEITEYPENLQEGDTLAIKGISNYSNSTILVYIQKNEEEAVEKETETDSKGNWSYFHDESVRKGIYKIWAKSKDARGAISKASKEVSVKVTLPILFTYGKIAIDYLTMIFTLIALIVLIFLLVFYAWYRVSVWRKRITKETREISRSVTGAFRALRDEVEEQISLLDKKPGLTKEEKAIRDKLQEALDISEKFIGKEIKDVEKELE